jgi:hypothetical protein
MKRNLIIFFLLGAHSIVSAQSDTVLKAIFIPHPRSEDKVNQSVLPGIEAINFDLYDMIMLGGDLTYYTSISKTSMDYCDSLFDLGSPNTLWTMGNHDLSNRNRVEEYTGRPSFYSYSRDNITFLVLDTELDAAGFTSSHILGDQLEMIQQVCDTITQSDYLVLLHHRLLWMIGNDYFTPKLDSVAESTKQLDTSNFYTVVYPLLQQAKHRGVPVLCLGGDKSRIIINYSQEDSITFIASPMAPEYTDEQNNVVILSSGLQTGQLSWEFIPLSEVEKNPPVSQLIDVPYGGNIHMQAVYNQALSAIEVEFISTENQTARLEIYSVSGQRIYSDFIDPGGVKTFRIHDRGLYLVKLSNPGLFECQKVTVP